MGQPYALQYKAKLADPSWLELPASGATGTSTTLTDNDPAHRAPGSGFWRVVLK